MIRKICIKENLKFSFSSQKRNKPEVCAIKNKCAMVHQKKKKKNVTPNIHFEKALEAERVNMAEWRETSETIHSGLVFLHITFMVEFWNSY